MIYPNKVFKAVMIVIGIPIITSCSAIFETDIENETVILVAPPDSMRTNLASQTFWWDFVDGADNYNLQIVSPRFDYIESVVTDTNLTTNKFQFTLIPGTYEWRVSAYNSAYATPYTVRTLLIDSTLDLSLQKVILRSPLASSAVNTPRLLFRWYKIYSATKYYFEIRKDNWEGELVTDPVETSADTISLALDEGNYAWGVKALNDNSGSQFSTRTFMVDRTAPSKPVLTAPASGKIYSSLPIQLTWERPDISGSAITDSIYIATDSLNFLNTIKVMHKTTNTMYNIGFSDEGDYYWRIRSIDAAGNKSPQSDIRKFVIQAK